MTKLADRVHRGSLLAVAAFALLATIGPPIASELFATAAAISALWLFLRDLDRKAWVESDQLRVGADLRKREDRYRALVELSPQAVWFADSAGRITYANAWWLEYCGLTVEELAGEKGFELLRPDFRKLVRDLWIEKAAEGKAWSLEVPLRRARDGEYRWHSVRTEPILVDGSANRWIGIAIDIDDREQSKRERDRFAFLVENASDAIGIYDLNGQALFLNGAGKKLVGIDSVDDVARASISDNFFPDDQEFVFGQLVPRALRDGASNAEVRFRHSRTGAGIWMDLGVLVMRKDDGSTAGIATIGRDVSEQRYAREEIAASQRFLRSALDSLSSQIVVLDESGIILAVNEAWRRFAEEHGQDSTPFGVGARYADVWAKVIGIADSQASEANRLVFEVMQGTHPTALMEYPARPDHGEELWFQMRVTRFPGSGPSRVVVAHEHITPRVRSELALRARSEQLQRTARLATELSVLHDIDSILGVVTDGARLIIGAERSIATLTTETTSGQDRTVYSPSNDGDGALDPLQTETRDKAMVAEVRISNRPLRLNRSDLENDPRWNDRATRETDSFHSWLGAPLIGLSGVNTGLIRVEGGTDGVFTIDDEAVLVQIAQMASIAIENARLYETLREADRRKDEFLATLAHELRNPLAPIRFWLEVMKLDADQESIEKARSTIDRQVTQMVRLIDDLLDISRITFDKLELRKERIDLASVIASAVEASRPGIDAKRHTLVVDFPRASVPLDADSARLAQMLSNLLNNAAKYTDPGGRIDLIATIDAGTVVITVKDDGIGIPADILPRVFDRFLQADRSLLHSEGGLGIGLSLVRWIAEKHGGKVNAHSTSAGSAFEVRLPLAATEHAFESVAPGKQGAKLKTPKEVSSRRVLIVDDNRDSTESLSLLLRIFGHDCRVAYDGIEALNLAREFLPDLVLLDIGLPRMNGLEVAQQIRKSDWGKSMVLIAVTGWGQEGDRRRSHDAGFNHHLVKPVDVDVLRALLDTPVGG